jgi:hypothetical protein
MTWSAWKGPPTLDLTGQPVEAERLRAFYFVAVKYISYTGGLMKYIRMKNHSDNNTAETVE